MKLLIFLTSCLCLVHRAECGESSASPPNVVFILIDDLRYDTFGYTGHPFVETPHIDALAKGGMQFTNAFVTTSLCSPSRTSFLTGRYMHNHKVVDNVDRMAEGTVTFPQLLRQADYETAFIGKWHMGGSSDAARPGFDHWVSFRGQGTYAPGKKTLNVNGKQVPRKKYIDHPPDFDPVRVRESGLSNSTVFWRLRRSRSRRNTAGRIGGGGLIV